MKNSLMVTFVAVVATLVGGCQAVKEGGDNLSTSFQQPNKSAVQQTIGELLALSGVEVRWNYLPEKYRGRDTDYPFNLSAGEDPPIHISCDPQPATSYPRSRQSVTQPELYFIALQLVSIAVACADPDNEEYQWSYKAAKKTQEMLRQIGVFDGSNWSANFSSAFLACMVDADVQKYKRQNPGRPVDVEVLNWLKDNMVLECDHSGARIDDNLLETRLRSQVRKDESLGDAVNISVTAFNGIVLLTGEQRRRAGEIVEANPSTRKLVNELELAGKTNVIGRANDALLTGKVKTQLLKDENTAPTIKVVTEHGKVYLLGLVTQAEADAAVESARSVDGVAHIVKVFEYIE